CASTQETPLSLACERGHESVVYKLLSLGAMQRTLSMENRLCPLKIAVRHGCVDVVRVLINEGGITAVGAEIPLAAALCLAVGLSEARTFQLLLTAGGEEGRSGRANTPFMSSHLLHDGVFRSHPAVVSVLLEAGADETVWDSKGRFPRDLL
ncbi:unnamed protein product, partial [Laminaria digitata]